MSVGGEASLGSSPVVVRIGGLPIESVEGFASELCATLPTAERLEATLAAARETLTDRLFEAIHGAPKRARRFLLKVKRDCFNQRPITKHRQSPAWKGLVERVGPAAQRVIDLEVERDELLAAREQAFAACRNAQLDRLLDHLDQPAFMRGVAMASALVYRNRNRLRAKPPSDYGRREKRLAATLLRYLSRAALKCSPYSTFTPVGLGTLDDAGDVAGLALTTHPWAEHSLVRVKRFLLDQYVAMALAHPPFRDTLPVVLNDSVVDLEDHRVLFLRPSHWAMDPSRGKVSFFDESFVKVVLKGPVIDRLRSWLVPTPGRDRLTYASLCRRLEGELGAEIGRETLAENLDKLLEIGFLQLATPWASNEGHLEKALLAHLRQAPASAALTTFVDRLDRLVAAQDGYAEAEDPANALEGIEDTVESLWRAAAALGGLDPSTERGKPSIHNVYEDVVRRPTDTSHTPLLTLPRATAQQVMDSIRPLVRLTDLYDHRHDFLHAMAAFCADRWPGRARVGVLELFDAIQPTWQSFMRFRIEARQQGAWRSTWNPLELDAVTVLEAWRAKTWNHLPGCFRDDQGEDRQIDRAALGRMLDAAPSRYTRAMPGACVFLQPADAEGSLWMVNRMKEGTGRYGSRYTPAFDAASRAHYVRRLEARGRFEIDGEPVELLDLASSQGDTLNVHATQTPRVLDLPGTRNAASPEQRVGLGDLAVEVPEDGGAPTLRDRGGRRLLPVHLGVAYLDYMPTLVKFLCVFGPSEMETVFPPKRRSRRNGLQITGRTTIGNVALHRRSWSVPLDDLQAITESGSDDTIFFSLNRWRIARGIPDRVFMIENVPHPIRGDRYQPQYLDFTSPLFVALLQSILAQSRKSLTLVESLPEQHMFPRDRAGRRWAVEILLDALALGPIEPSPLSFSGDDASLAEPARAGGEPCSGAA